jgi:8-amino-7-oxononanoate synthase
MAFHFIQQKLQQQQRDGCLRQRTCIEHYAGREIRVAGQSYLNFSSNDYLGLNRHPKIAQAMQYGLDNFGLCATGSSLLTGFHYAHQALEHTVCDWLNKPRCLLFSSGFAANTGLLQALGNNNSLFWLDKLSHASMIDGALASAAKVKRFAHNNCAQLADSMAKVSAVQADNQLIFSEGVFSMDGDQANISALSALAKQHNAWLAIDDAHAIGVLGEQGQGSVSVGDIDIVMATFGKALATSGAFIACDVTLHDYLLNFCRHYIYSTAMSPALAWATKTAIELAQTETWRRDKLFELTAQLRSALNVSIELLPASSSIQAIIIGDANQAVNVSAELKRRGIWLSAIRPPTVPQGKSRLRVTICASHNKRDISMLADNLNEILT